MRFIEFYQIMGLNGVIVATLNSIGKYYQIKIATAVHKNIWRVHYNNYGILEPVEQKFRVETLGKTSAREYFRFRQKLIPTKYISKSYKF